MRETAARPSRRRGTEMIEQMFVLVNGTPRKSGPTACNKSRSHAVYKAMNTLTARTRSFLPTLLLMLLAGVLVLVVLPAILAAAGATAT